MHIHTHAHTYTHTSQTYTHAARRGVTSHFGANLFLAAVLLAQALFSAIDIARARLSSVPLSQELTTWQQVFLNFYLKKYSGRRLQWYNSLSSCLL
eukprot:scaffold181596_cov16-Tisochrysis_lutea.AAC.1